MKVEEAARSTDEGIKHFIEPAPGTLRRATSRRHHIIFGRRGSGKSSLLRKAAADLTTARRPIAYVNLEAFKGNSYPDVLLSVLISAFQKFNAWLHTTALRAAERVPFWQRLQRLLKIHAPRAPSRDESVAEVSLCLQSQIDALENELQAADAAELSLTTGTLESVETLARAGGRIISPAVSASAEQKVSSAASRNERVQEQFRRSKIDFLRHHVMEYQRTLRAIAQLSSGDSYLLLDDLYHLRREDQPQVIDYFHRMAQDHDLWLKSGTALTSNSPARSRRRM